MPTAARREPSPLTIVTTVVSAISVAGLLWAASLPGQPLLAYLGSAFFGLLAGVLWACAAVHARLTRRSSVTLLAIALTVLAVLPVAFLTPVPLTIRFAASYPAFALTVNQLSAPDPLPVREDPEDEEYDGWFIPEGRCPGVVGAYAISACDGFPAGYLLYSPAGSGVFDDGGFAYLPNGIPAGDVGTGAFESPEFTHILGDWYAFRSSW